MKNIIVFDLEANGLLEESTEMYCISSLTSTKGLSSIYKESLTRESIISLLVEPNLPIVGHNIIGYDLPMIRKFFDLDIINLLGRENIIDTLIFSQCLFPDRQLPIGCPTTISNPVTKRSKKVTPHGLEAWGYRVGRKKLEIHDWREFTPDIISRCEEDVKINYDVYLMLLKEAGMNVLP